MNNLLIIGAGQFGQVTKEIAESVGIYKKIDFIDDNSEIAIGKMSEIDKYKNNYSNAIVAIGNPTIRKDIITQLETEGFKIVTLISPVAYVSNSAKIGNGCIIEPFAIVNANTEIGKSTLICAGSIINHNTIVKDYCHINCGAIIKSNTTVEEATKVDYGEIV